MRGQAIPLSSHPIFELRIYSTQWQLLRPCLRVWQVLQHKSSARWCRGDGAGAVWNGAERPVERLERHSAQVLWQEGERGKGGEGGWGEQYMCQAWVLLITVRMDGMFLHVCSGTRIIWFSKLWSAGSCRIWCSLGSCIVSWDLIRFEMLERVRNFLWGSHNASVPNPFTLQIHNPPSLTMSV